MGIELVQDKTRKKPINPKKSINKIFFETGRKNGIYLRTLGNIVMLVPPFGNSRKGSRIASKQNNINHKRSKT